MSKWAYTVIQCNVLKRKFLQYHRATVNCVSNARQCWCPNPSWRYCVLFSLAFRIWLLYIQPSIPAYSKQQNALYRQVVHVAQNAFDFARTLRDEKGSTWREFAPGERSVISVRVEDVCRCPHLCASIQNVIHRLKGCAVCTRHGALYVQGTRRKQTIDKILQTVVICYGSYVCNYWA